MIRKLIAKQPLVRSLSYRSTFENDKWTTDKMVEPVNRVMELPKNSVSTYAFDLFRHGYNTSQLGYYFQSLELITTYGRVNNGFPKDNVKELAESLENLGVPEIIYKEILPELYKTKQQAHIATFVKCFEFYFSGHFKTIFAKLNTNHAYSAKHCGHLNKMIGQGLSMTSGYRIYTTVEYDSAIFGGWNLSGGGYRVGESYLNEIKAIEAKVAHEKLFDN
jgi:hypothetical protein